MLNNINDFLANPVAFYGTLAAGLLAGNYAAYRFFNYLIEREGRR
jgi:hypothetical protein